MNAVNIGERAALLPSRRQRVRAATEAEILGTARELLTAEGVGSVTLREVGRRMGMTASALYRYVDGHTGLVDRLTASLYDELADTLLDALDRWRPSRDGAPALPAETAIEGLMIAADAFRAWSLAHQGEFTLMFGAGRRFDGGCPLTHEAGERFGRVFADLFVRGLAGGPAAAPPQAHPAEPPGQQDSAHWKTQLPQPAAELFGRSWIRLLGLVMVEVAGEYQHDYLALDPAEIFKHEMSALGTEIAAVLEAAVLDAAAPSPVSG